MRAAAPAGGAPLPVAPPTVPAPPAGLDPAAPPAAARAGRAGRADGRRPATPARPTRPPSRRARPADHAHARHDDARPRAGRPGAPAQDAAPATGEPRRPPAISAGQDGTAGKDGKAGRPKAAATPRPPPRPHQRGRPHHDGDRPAAQTRAAPAPSPQPVREIPLPRAPHAVGQLIQLAQTKGVCHAKLHLRPAELGGIEIRLATDASGLTASVIADSPQAAAMLQGAADDLRRQLERSGVTVANLEISTALPDAGNAGDGAGADGASGGSGPGTTRRPGPAEGDRARPSRPRP